MSGAQKYYDSNSTEYVQKWSLEPEGLQRPHNYYRLKIIERMLSLAAIKAGERVIEVGCGTGLVLKEALKVIKPIYGTDISQEMLRRVKDAVLSEKSVTILKDFSASSIAGLEVDVVLMQDDAVTSQLPHQFFDKVLSMEVARYIEDLPAYLKTIRGIIKDQGIFVFTATNVLSLSLFPFKYNLRKLFNHIDVDNELAQYFVTARSLKQALAKADFSILAFERFGLLSANNFVFNKLIATRKRAEQAVVLDQTLSRVPIINQLFDTFIVAVTPSSPHV